MTDVPFKALTALSAISSYAVVSLNPKILPFTLSYVGTFLLSWTIYFFSWAFYRVIIYPKILSPLKHFPTAPADSWWNGSFPSISAKATGAPMRKWVGSIPNDGIIRYFGLFNSERIIITSPKALGEVLTTQNYSFEKPSQIQAGLGRLLGVGVLLAEGEEHKRQRKNLMPAFAFRHVKDLYPVFWDKSCEAVEAMTVNIEAGGISNEDLPEAHKRPVTEENQDAIIEVGEWASRATLDIIGIAGMGKDFGAIQNPDTPLNKTYRTVFKPSKQAQILGLLNLFLPGWFVSRIPMKRNGEIEAAVAIIRQTCRALIRHKKEKLEMKVLTDVDILSVALESGGFTEENLIDQMMTFLAAGHETTATAMTWAIYMLCLNQDVQTRLREEIRSHLPAPSSGKTVTAAELDALPYLNAVTNEVLRYYPPVPLTLRNAVKDTTIAGHHIPKGTRVMLVPWAINYSEALWGPTASQFDPSRWLPSEGNPHAANGGAASNYSNLTFLHGPRGCIGQAFAKAEFKCLLAAWVGRMSFEVSNMLELEEENVLIKGGVTAKPEKGMYVKTKVIPGW